MIPLVRRNEAVAWVLALLAVWALLAATGFTSRDPDSAFYAAMSARLANGPLAAVIAPEWGGLWNGTGLWQEHPVGIYLAYAGDRMPERLTEFLDQHGEAMPRAAYRIATRKRSPADHG